MGLPTLLLWAGLVGALASGAPRPNDSKVYDYNVALNNRTTVVNRGKVLGGSSAINLLSWNRAAVVEYDQWETVGNPGWNWKSMNTAMLKAENYTGGPAEIIFFDGFAGGYLSPSDPLYSQVPKPHFFALLVAIQHPLSTGSVHINSSSPLHGNPVINPNYLSNEYEIAACIAALSWARMCRRRFMGWRNGPRRWFLGIGRGSEV
ncbi:hypothetical protein QBC45DRAFT_443552 [Copromyces sp. CBS 386.78]|nr:hypothetical protein QBC45DRAFT_443552 [Copromyces sp. CBS 386.78]